MKQVRLNRVEVWIADHALPIFAVVALAIVLGAGAIAFVFFQTREANDQVNVLKPQVTRVNKAICDKQSLNHPQRAERCAERIRVGLINCRRSTSCRAAYLALATYPPPARPARGATSSPQPSPGSPRDTGGGDAIQPPSHQGHQQPGPGKGPNQPAGGAPSPSPGSEGQGAPEPSPGPEEAAPSGNGGDSSSSGPGVEVCVLERTCVGVEVGLGP